MEAASTPASTTPTTTSPTPTTSGSLLPSQYAHNKWQIENQILVGMETFPTIECIFRVHLFHEGPELCGI